jgi:hypothetical protein
MEGEAEGVRFAAHGRVTNKELWQELQELKTAVAVLRAEYRSTAGEVEKLKARQAELLRIAGENLVAHERIAASLRTLGVKVGFWAFASGAAVSVVWNAVVMPLLNR